MQLNKVLEKVGVTVVRIEKPGTTLRLFLRSSRDKRQFMQWKGVIEEYLLASVTNAAQRDDVGWGVDISQAYYVTAEGAIRYLWRVIITGNLKNGAENFGQAVLRVVSQSVEVTSMPLVGRKKYEFDPANGKMMGAHDQKSASAIVATGIGGGGNQ